MLSFPISCCMSMLNGIFILDYILFMMAKHLFNVIIWNKSFFFYKCENIKENRRKLEIEGIHFLQTCV